jgi:hypothetical protein
MQDVTHGLHGQTPQTLLVGHALVIGVQHLLTQA